MRALATGKGIVAQETRVLIRETPRFATLAVTSLHKTHKRPRATRRRGSSRDVPWYSAVGYTERSFASFSRRSPLLNSQIPDSLCPALVVRAREFWRDR